MKELFYSIRDRIQEWFKYSQPTSKQKELLGMYTDVIDTEFTAVRLASEDAAKYVLEHMRTVPNFKRDYDFRQYISSLADDSLLMHSKEGLILEFGVASGRTLNQFARYFPTKIIHGFDSFKGLPEDWLPRFGKGYFSRNKPPVVRGNCQLHIGWFDQTLPKFLKNNKAPVALLHIDSDLYSSAVTVLTELNERIIAGTIIIFDEYINYPGWQLDEFKAWQEFCLANNVKYEYIGRVSRHQKVAVKVISREYPKKVETV